MKNKELRIEAYRHTYAVWAQKTKALDSFPDVAAPRPVAMEAAIKEREEARLAHGAARDGLAREILARL